VILSPLSFSRSSRRPAMSFKKLSAVRNSILPHPSRRPQSGTASSTRETRAHQEEPREQSAISSKNRPNLHVIPAMSIVTDGLTGARQHNHKKLRITLGTIHPHAARELERAGSAGKLYWEKRHRTNLPTRLPPTLLSTALAMPTTALIEFRSDANPKRTKSSAPPATFRPQTGMDPTPRTRRPSDSGGFYACGGQIFAGPARQAKS
jgi:hypothetical protein